MSWLKRYVRRWLELPEPNTVPTILSDRKYEDLALLTARAVASTVKDHEGRTILEKAVAQVLGLQWDKFTYAPTVASQKILGEALKDLIKEWDRATDKEDQEKLLSQVKREALSVVTELERKISHESFLDQVVERLKRKQVN